MPVGVQDMSEVALQIKEAAFIGLYDESTSEVVGRAKVWLSTLDRVTSAMEAARVSRYSDDLEQALKAALDRNITTKQVGRQWIAVSSSHCCVFGARE